MSLPHTVLAAVLVLGHPVACWAQRAVGHPLAGRSGGLEDLLEQAENMANEPAPANAPPPRPRAVQASEPPVPPRPPEAADGDLDRLIHDRNRDVDKHRVFPRLAALCRGQGLSLADQRDLVVGLHALLYRYGKLRALMLPDRNDPARAVRIARLEAECNVRDDFAEGRILVAVGWIYDGDTKRAVAHLEEATALLNNHGLNGFPLGSDCCFAWLLLGEHQRVSPFIDAIKKKDHTKVNAGHQWLVATFYWQQHRFNDADTYYRQALKKADVRLGKAGNAKQPRSEQLLADAALFYLTCGDPKKRSVEKGQKLLDALPEEAASWMAKRARAAGRAAAGDFTSAVQLMAEAAAHCPPHLDDVLAEQQASYAGQKEWIHDRN